MKNLCAALYERVYTTCGFFSTIFNQCVKLSTKENFICVIVHIKAIHTQKKKWWVPQIYIADKL